ncbi:MAG: hypothetical protein LBR79_03995 [Oscillospiraceae bacterium]|nr:hypothetical protein [Oscillospiraceae bacterium]
MAGGGERYYQLIWTTTKSPGKYFYTPSSILIAICKIYGQVYLVKTFLNSDIFVFSSHSAGKKHK